MLKSRLASTTIAIPQVHAVVQLAKAQLDIAAGDLDGVQELLVNAYRLARSSRDMPIIAMVAVGTADLLGSQGDAQRAAVLLGAAEVLRGSPDTGNPDVVRVSELLRTTLSPTDFDSYVAKGTNQTKDEALEMVAAQLGVADEVHPFSVVTSQ